MAKTNREGLTFREWYAAATCWAARGAAECWLPLQLARHEWSEGVDPTEWAAKLAEVPA